jgi:hypothetical protein
MTIEVEVNEEEFTNLLKVFLEGKTTQVRTEQPAEPPKPYTPIQPQKEKEKVEKAETEKEPEVEIETTAESEEDCFGNYDPNDPACKECGVARECKKETALRQKEKETPEEPETKEEESEEESAKTKGLPKVNLSAVPTLKEAVKAILKAGITAEDDVIAVLEEQKDNLPFDLPDNWKIKVKRLMLLLT